MSRFGKRVVDRALALAVLAVCSASIAAAQSFFSSDSSAKAVEIQGQVSVLKENYPWAVSLGSIIQPQQIVLTGADGFARFQVSDGSTFEVFPNSRVQFRANPGSLKDLVDLVLGRIRVHIEKIGGQPNPNSVRTPTAVISVRGTTFDVIAEDSSTTVAVTEGLVAVRHLLRPSKEEKLLTAGEALTVYKNEPLAKRQIDRGRVFQQIMGSAWDALATVMRSGGGRGAGSGTGGAGGPTLPGDTGGSAPPPPASGGGSSGGNAPAPPPPPPPGN